MYDTTTPSESSNEYNVEVCYIPWTPGPEVKLPVGGCASSKLYGRINRDVLVNATNAHRLALANALRDPEAIYLLSDYRFVDFPALFNLDIHLPILEICSHRYSVCLYTVLITCGLTRSVFYYYYYTHFLINLGL